MSLFKGLFRTKRKDSPLKEFLAGIDISKSEHVIRDIENPNIAASTLISLLVLDIASKHYFVSLDALVSSSPLLMSDSNKRFDHDLVVFEVAAFLHYFAIRKSLLSGEDDQEYDFEDNVFNLDVSKRISIQTTWSIFEKYTSLSEYRKNFFARITGYSLREVAVRKTEGVVWDQLSIFILGGFHKRIPAAAVKEVMLDMTALPVTLNNNNFATTWLEAFEESVSRIPLLFEI